MCAPSGYLPSPTNSSATKDIPTDRYVDPAYAKERIRPPLDSDAGSLPAGRNISRRSVTTTSTTLRTLIPSHHYPRRQKRHSRLLQRLPPSRYEAARLRLGWPRQQFKCSFHTDGAGISTAPTKVVVCQWDFPHVDRKNSALPQARVERLGGFVFINMDPGAPSLADYLRSTARAHIEAWRAKKIVTFICTFLSGSRVTGSSRSKPSWKPIT